MKIRTMRKYLLLVLLSYAALAQAGGDWEVVFSDPGTGDWQDHWFVEGLKATVENDEDGMVFTSGPVPKEQASHAVLWTKQSFLGFESAPSLVTLPRRGLPPTHPPTSPTSPQAY